MSQLSTFHVGKYLFGVDVSLVQEVVRLQLMTPVPLASPQRSRLKSRYDQEIRPALIERFGYSTPMQAPAAPIVTTNASVKTGIAASRSNA